MTIFNVRYTTNGINVYNYDYNYDQMFIFYTDYKKMIVLKENKPIYRIIERYSHKTHKMLLPKLEAIGSGRK